MPHLASERVARTGGQVARHTASAFESKPGAIKGPGGQAGRMSSLQHRKAFVRVSKPAAILLDIEGTTTDICFVSKTLFPFIKSNIGRYFTDTYETPETREMVQRLRDSRKPTSDRK